MILAFIDETGDTRKKEYFGLCCATINMTYYGGIKNGFQNILNKAGWNSLKEFKGSRLFSATTGDQSITPEKRVKIVSEMIDLNMAKENARMRFTYMKMEASSKKEAYLKALPLLLKKALPVVRNKRNGKDLLGLYFDYWWSSPR